MISSEFAHSSNTMQRHLDLEGLINFRDIGGYPVATANGTTHHTRWGKIFRSGHFAEAGENAQSQLHDLQVNTIFDLRSEREKEKKPNAFAKHHQTKTIDLNLDPGSGQSFKEGLARNGTEEFTEEDMANVMESINRSLIVDHSERYKTMFEHLLAGIDGACVIHCASGKDRTGLGIALVLLALGVDEETVMEDYMLSNQYLKIDQHLARAIQDFGNQFSSSITPEALRPVYEVRQSYLGAALEEVRNSFGDIDTFLYEAIGLCSEKRQILKNYYLD